jgi:hypothetical protein
MSLQFRSNLSIPSHRKIRPPESLLICLYLLLAFIGKIFLWILCYVYLGLKEDVIAFLWLWIDSLKWLTSYHVIKLMMLLNQGNMHNPHDNSNGG